MTNNPSDLHMVRRNQSSLESFRSECYAQSGCKGSVTTSLHLVPFCQYAHSKPSTCTQAHSHPVNQSFTLQEYSMTPSSLHSLMLTDNPYLPCSAIIKFTIPACYTSCSHILKGKYIYIYIYMYIKRERKREEREFSVSPQLRECRTLWCKCE